MKKANFEKEMNQALETIVKETFSHLDIETLETRGSDDLDFHEISVWTLKKALELAYAAGRESAEKK